jgi:hypothetical protein
MHALRRAARVVADRAGGPEADGFRYRDRDATPDGIRRLEIEAGEDSAAEVRGHGSHLAVPPLESLALPLRAQLRSPHGCWEARFAAAGVLRHDERRFLGYMLVD